MSNESIPRNRNTAEFSFLGSGRRVVTRQRQGQYLSDGKLELGNYAVTWERTFDERGRPLVWKFFEDSALSSISEYRYEGEECIVTERDTQGKAIETTKQKPFSVTIQGSQQSAPRSEEHTSELQSHLNLVCRLLLEKKKIKD